MSERRKKKPEPPLRFQMVEHDDTPACPHRGLHGWGECELVVDGELVLSQLPPELKNMRLIGEKGEPDGAVVRQRR